MKLFKLIIVIALFIPLTVLTGCKGNNKKEQMEAKKTTEANIQKAVCVLYPTEGNKTTGTVVFIKTDSGIKIIADVKGLSKGKHGFHIHEYGDCSSSDAASAGGHFNPYGKIHGAPADSVRHGGDLGNIIADKTGKAHYEYTDNEISFEGKNSIIGRSVIVHKNKDDLKSQPSGNAGSRVACGVIGISK